MLAKYLLVFIAVMVLDMVPFPLPPAFTVMIFLQIYYNLDIWPVIIIGVAGSVIGRYMLSVYIQKVAKKVLKPSKNEDVIFLGTQLKENGWKSQLVIFSYSLLPLPTTPLFIAGGMAKMKPYLILPSFFAGKFISDAIAVFAGEYVTDNVPSLLEGVVSWKSISGLILGLLLLAALLFVNWRNLLQNKKITLNFKIWR